MKVSELAKQYDTTIEEILKRLRALKLKAKDGKQELSRAVISVLKRELVNLPKKKASATQAAPQQTAQASEKKTPKAPAKKKTTPRKAPVKKKKDETKPKKTETKTTKKSRIPADSSKARTRKKIDATPFVPVKPLSKKKRKPVKTKEDGAAFKKPSDLTTKPADPTSIGRAGGAITSVQGVPPPSADAGATVSREDLTPLELHVPISVKDFSVAVQQKTSVVLKKLIDMKIFATINQSLDEDMARKLAELFGYEILKLKTTEEQLLDLHRDEGEDPALLKSRAPVVTLMGHVDHGKTSLLDKIRQSQIVDREHGGITQHIGAYSVPMDKGKITFLDTPGHEAFTSMRARGAHITDLVILVVAADEGIMPQTEEAIDHARAADVPIVVALNKIDRRNADPDRVKKQLAAKDLNPEDWGGKTIVVPVSAVTGEGIDNLLEMMLLEAELLELKANPDKKASGIVVEAHLSPGKGSVASLIIQSGTLRAGDYLVAGPFFARIKAMFDDHERPIQEAGPSTPVEILGLNGVPEAGEMFFVVDDERLAKEITTQRQHKLKMEKLQAGHRITLEDLYSQIQQGTIKELNVILKADVQGSLEALKDSLQKIPSEEVKVKFIHTGVGDVNASDVILAMASNAIIIAFQVGIGPRAKDELEKNPVDVRQYRIIYDAVNDVKKALEGLLEPKKKRKFLGRIEVRQVFKLSKAGMIAGCYVLKGKATRKSQVDVIRDGKVIHSGTISSLKRFKDDVREVSEGYECGISVSNFDEIKEGDLLETFEVETIERTL